MNKIWVKLIESLINAYIYCSSILIRQGANRDGMTHTCHTSSGIYDYISIYMPSYMKCKHSVISMKVHII